MSEKYTKLPGDDNEKTEPVEGAEEFLVGQNFDFKFGVLRISEMEEGTDLLGRKCRKGTPIVSFTHRRDAEEYARWLHSGKTSIKEQTIDDLRGRILNETTGILKDALAAAKDHYTSLGKVSAQEDFLKRLGFENSKVVTESEDGSGAEYDENSFVTKMEKRIVELVK